jgi:serine/threonine protein kinase
MLKEYISPTRPMTEAAARFYFTQLIDGLSYCHDQARYATTLLAKPLCH